MRPDPELAPVLRARIEDFGQEEWNQLNWMQLSALSPAVERYLLGAGCALTAFLIAPVPVKLNWAEYRSLCSQGAVVNLMVVMCDRLLDGGSSLDSVLPPFELAAGGGDSSPVMGLLRQYFQRLQSLGANDRLQRTIGRVVRQMFEAEARTINSNGEIAYRFWLRKSALPFVLMALPVWSCCGVESADAYFRHVRWLYRVGRFFGAVDDAVDFVEDSCSGHPNCWYSWRRQSRPSAARRVAAWGKGILDEWDSLMRMRVESAIIRETFLHNIWEWLGPARSARGHC